MGPAGRQRKASDVACSGCATRAATPGAHLTEKCQPNFVAYMERFTPAIRMSVGFACGQQRKRLSGSCALRVTVDLPLRLQESQTTTSAAGRGRAESAGCLVRLKCREGGRERALHTPAPQLDLDQHHRAQSQACAPWQRHTKCARPDFASVYVWRVDQCDPDRHIRSWRTKCSEVAPEEEDIASRKSRLYRGRPSTSLMRGVNGLTCRATLPLAVSNTSTVGSARPLVGPGIQQGLIPTKLTGLVLGPTAYST